jgi:hypothetical protein
MNATNRIANDTYFGAFCPPGDVDSGDGGGNGDTAMQS